MRKLAILLAAASLFASCKKEFDLDLKNDNRNLLVVEGTITDLQGPQYVKLSRTISYLKQEKPVAVDNATVMVKVDNETIPFVNKGNGMYVAPKSFFGEVGKTYRLEVVTDGQTYTATTTMNPPLPLTNLATQKYEFDSKKVEARVTFTDNPNNEDYILFKYAINGEVADTLSEWTCYSDRLLNGQELVNARVFGDIDAKEGDHLTVFTYSISKNFFEFISAAEASTQEPTPFFPPPGAAIKGNISNGAVGFFQASAVRSSTVIVTK